jgi:hypothetical protein
VIAAHRPAWTVFKLTAAGFGYTAGLILVGLYVFSPDSVLARSILFATASAAGLALVWTLALARAAARSYAELPQPLHGRDTVEPASFRAQASARLAHAGPSSVAVILFEIDGLETVAHDCGRESVAELVERARRQILRAVGDAGRTCDFGDGRFAALVDQADASLTLQVVQGVPTTPAAAIACGHTHLLQIATGFASNRQDETLDHLVGRAEARLVARSRRRSDAADISLTGLGA